MSDHTFRRLFEPFSIGKVELRNRLVSTPMPTQLPNDRDLAFIETRARGGLGMMQLAVGGGTGTFEVGYGPEEAAPQFDTKPISGATPKGIAFWDDVEIPRLRKYAEILHRHGTKGFGQSAHKGPNGTYEVDMNPVLGPSTIPTEVDFLNPHPVSEEEIEEYIFCFAQTVRRLAEAGLDGAEIHGAHGYFVCNFLSPYYNRRTDKWGGSTENRARLPIEMIAAARKLVGDDFPIGVRISYEGAGGNGPGITYEELVGIAKVLEPSVSYLSVSGGNFAGIFNGLGPVYSSSPYWPPSYNAEPAAMVKKAVNVPVIISGRNLDPASAESLLAEGAADLIGMVRSIIADPELPNKARTGQAGRQRMCIGLLECRNEGRYRTHMTCGINASAGREEELAIVPAVQPKTVVVVGSGPAGLEATRVAALRGHKVYLCDRESTIGGTVRLLGSDPNRRQFLDHSAYFEGEFAELDVQLVLGHEVSADDIAGFDADAVIIATGGKPRIPDVPGIDSANVITWKEALLRNKPIGKRVLVVGGSENHMQAGTIADFFGTAGHEVQLISEQLDFAWLAEQGTRYALQTRLHRQGIIPQLATRLASVDDGGVVLRDVLSGAERRVDDVTVVLACGLVQDDGLYHALKGKVSELYVVGDAFAPRRIMHATVDGARVATAL